jgi:hypothetical protein
MWVRLCWRDPDLGGMGATLAEVDELEAVDLWWYVQRVGELQRMVAQRRRR